MNKRQKMDMACWLTLIACVVVALTALSSKARSEPCDIEINYTLPTARTNDALLSLDDIAAVTLFGTDENGVLTVFNLTEFSVVPKSLNHKRCQGHTVEYSMVVADTLGLVSESSNKIKITYANAKPNPPVINTIEKTGQNVTLSCIRCRISLYDL